jgi:hypothetical protein
MRTTFPFVSWAALQVLCLPAFSDPIAVRHVQGYLHGFLVLKDSNQKVLAAGDVIQTPAADRLNTDFRLRFHDGSLYEETSVFSQRHVYRLLTYKQVEKGPAFKKPMTVSIDTASGNVDIHAVEGGKDKTIVKRLALPPDLANGIITTVLNDIDPKTETTLSMLVFAPEPRVVKLRISSVGQDSFSIGGFENRANHYVVNIDIGGVTGVVAKVAGKQPPPINMWVAAGAPVFVRSDGPLYEDGPIWRIELASPSWPNRQSP